VVCTPPLYGNPLLYGTRAKAANFFLGTFEIIVIFEEEKYPPYKDPLPIRNFGGSNDTLAVPYRGGVVYQCIILSSCASISGAGIKLQDSKDFSNIFYLWTRRHNSF